MRHFIVIMIVILFSGCSDKNSCNWNLIVPIPVNNEINEDLINNIFSKNNDMLNNVDSSLLIITDEQDLSEIYDGESSSLGINFEKVF